MVSCVTAGFNTPGVHLASGLEYGPDPFAWQEPAGGCSWMTAALAVDTGRAPAGARACLAGARACLAGARCAGSSERFTRAAGVAVTVVDVTAGVADTSAGALVVSAALADVVLGTLLIDVWPHADTPAAAAVAKTDRSQPPRMPQTIGSTRDQKQPVQELSSSERGVRQGWAAGRLFWG
ncbi:MAG: hypothetical protein ACJ780_29155 [Solirubrobacteraceae bacterium]